MVLMASETEDFSFSEPFHLTSIDWGNENHRRSVAASLVQGVYILEQDRQAIRQGRLHALDPRWWEFFHFELFHHLVDDADSSIFCAIYKFNLPAFHLNHSLHGSPRYVIAFRGTLIKLGTFFRDLKLDLAIIRNILHRTSRFQIAVQFVQSFVTEVGHSNVWLAGHSLGSAIAMLAGKTMAKTGIFLEPFLFNPPFSSVPIEIIIKDKRLKRVIRIAKSLITTGLTVARKTKHHRKTEEDQFVALSPWVPRLFVNPRDVICSEYIGYFEHRKKMEEIGAGGIGRLATQNSIKVLGRNAFRKGKEYSEPLHHIPSASLTINLSPSQNFKQAHRLKQWWSPDLKLQSKLYKYREL
ncbi:GDSL esterase/lipase At4g10955-like [Alnus glutinosa]|uniref:GDSL esterase/lipase At4g10955-like n=1 Tax=Alnus glutinosa TaxID=3517 RepID=UPI002D797FDD|nr:GDSL esterase/lipase At4g10955-like [Alnus glutinosa]